MAYLRMPRCCSGVVACALTDALLQIWLPDLDLLPVLHAKRPRPDSRIRYGDDPRLVHVHHLFLAVLPFAYLLLLIRFPHRTRSGEELWQYDARLPEGILPCCDVINRGASGYTTRMALTDLNDTLLVSLPASERPIPSWSSRRCTAA